MKRKSLTLLVCLLACLALGSVGFAAWVITADNSDTATGQVRVDVVKDARLQVEAEIDGTIVFGSRAKTSSIAYDWMKYEQTLEGTEGAYFALDENLTVTLKLTIGSFSNLKAEGTALTVTFSDAEDQAFFESAIAKEYVAALPVVSYTKAQLEGLANAAADDASKLEDDVLYLEIDYTFAWGNAFGGTNPIDFYNSQAYDKTLADGAITTLQDLSSILENVTYLVTIEPVTDYN